MEELDHDSLLWVLSLRRDVRGGLIVYHRRGRLDMSRYPGLRAELEALLAGDPHYEDFQSLADIKLGGSPKSLERSHATPRSAPPNPVADASADDIFDLLTRK